MYYLSGSELHVDICCVNVSGRVILEILDLLPLSFLHNYNYYVLCVMNSVVLVD